MGALLFIFLDEGVDEGGSTLHFLNEGVDDGGSALHFLDEGTSEGFCSAFPQNLDSRLTTTERLYREITQRDYLDILRREITEILLVDRKLAS